MAGAAPDSDLVSNPKAVDGQRCIGEEDRVKTRVILLCLFSLALTSTLSAQEAASGFELNSTISGEALYSPQLAIPSRDDVPAMGAFRVVLYPTWKLSKHWTLFGSLQGYSRPYFYEDFATPGPFLAGNILQANVSYSQFWENRSLIVRVGELSSAFGSFLLRYDDAVNPLVDMPASYGYYLKGVTTVGLPGAEVDATLGKLDTRLQFTNSSPANPLPLTEPRSIWRLDRRRGLHDSSRDSA